MTLDIGIKLAHIGLSAVVTRADGTVEDLGVLCEDFSEEERERVLLELLGAVNDGATSD